MDGQGNGSHNHFNCPQQNLFLPSGDQPRDIQQGEVRRWLEILIDLELLSGIFGIVLNVLGERSPPRVLINTSDNDNHVNIGNDNAIAFNIQNNSSDDDMYEDALLDISQDVQHEEPQAGGSGTSSSEEEEEEEERRDTSDSETVNSFDYADRIPHEAEERSEADGEEDDEQESKQFKCFFDTNSETVNDHTDNSGSDDLFKDAVSSGETENQQKEGIKEEAQREG